MKLATVWIRHSDAHVLDDKGMALDETLLMMNSDFSRKSTTLINLQHD